MFVFQLFLMNSWRKKSITYEKSAVIAVPKSTHSVYFGWFLSSLSVLKYMSSSFLATMKLFSALHIIQCHTICSPVQLRILVGGLSRVIDLRIIRTLLYIPVKLVATCNYFWSKPYKPQSKSIMILGIIWQYQWFISPHYTGDNLAVLRVVTTDLLVGPVHFSTTISNLLAFSQDRSDS